MRTRARSNGCGSIQRRSFTLIELMVVITIIAALVALSASAVLKFIQVQQDTNTQSTLDRVQSQLAKAWSKVKDDAKKAPMTDLANGPGILALGLPYTGETTVQAWIQRYLSGSDANATERTRMIYIKLKLKQAFPVSFNEALNPAPFLPLPGYQQYLNNLLITGSSLTTAPFESSACLLMALQRGVSGAGINPSELTAGGAAGAYVTPNGGNLPYLNDAWGRPIFFSRAPAGNLYLNPINATSVANSYPTMMWGGTTYPVTCYSQPGTNDPGDPQGYLSSAAWRTAFGGAFFMVTSEVLPLTPNTSYKLAPVLASGGQTNWTKTGIIPPFDPITFATLPGSGALFSTPQ